MNLDVIPILEQYQSVGTDTLSGASIAIIAEPAITESLPFLDDFADELKKGGIETNVAVSKGHAPESAICVELQLTGSETLGDEGYELRVDENGIELIANKPAGIFYALQTLHAIVAQSLQNGRISLEHCRIVDRPRFMWRGFMLDCARTFQPVDRIKKIISLMSRLKLNVFHWHVTDSQSWTIESRKFPKLNLAADQSRGQYYTRDDIREIIDYARQRQVTVIPEIEMPSHCFCVLASYPEYACPTQAADKYAAYCIGQPKTIEFLQEVLRETAELFDTPYIHIGGDERPAGLWAECPHCSALMKRLGLDDENQLQNWFMNEMAQFVENELGRKTIAWVENLKDGYPEGQILQGWRTGSPEAALAHGAQLVNSLHEHSYFDYPQTAEEVEIYFDWMEFLPLEKVYEFDPIPQGTPQEKRHLVLGAEAPLWTAFTPDEQMLYHQMLPRLIAYAEVCWARPDRKDYGDFMKRLPGVRGWLNRAGLWPEFESELDYSVFPKR